MTDRQKYIRRIQKLKALAKGEAESGNEKAAESAARIIAKMSSTDRFISSGIM